MKENYDQLSPLGERQARALGDYWARRGFRPDNILCGPRKRHIDTARIAAHAAREADVAWPEAIVTEALDEYHGDPLVRTCLPQLAGRDDELGALYTTWAEGEQEARVKAIERIFVILTRQWVQDSLSGFTIEPEQVEPWAAFRKRVTSLISEVMDRAGNTVFFTSAGPTAAAVQMSLELTDLKTLELSWTVRNSCVAEFLIDRERFALTAFNSGAHLADADITYI